MKPKYNPAAKALASTAFRKRVVKSGKDYTRKGRNPSGPALDAFWGVASATLLSRIM